MQKMNCQKYVQNFWDGILAEDDNYPDVGVSELPPGYNNDTSALLRYSPHFDAKDSSYHRLCGSVILYISLD
jgi:hypothetical protein